MKLRIPPPHAAMLALAQRAASPRGIKALAAHRVMTPARFRAPQDWGRHVASRHLVHLIVALCLFLSPLCTWAQTTRFINDEYDEVAKGAKTITAFGPELFGESVNLKDGSTSFSATDVAIPTNSGLSLSIGRTLSITSRDADRYVDPTADGELFGNWKLDVPVISGTFDERTGWAPVTRCSSAAPPPSVKSAYAGWNLYYYAEEYWHGNVVSIPGKGSYPLLGLLDGSVVPTDGKTYRWTTKGRWSVSCIPLRNGAGEGFLVALPDGTKYSFDWMSSRRAASLKDTHCSQTSTDWEVRGYDVGNANAQQLQYMLESGGDGGSVSGGTPITACNTQIVVNRREFFLHATRVEDRFGNAVTYTYDAANPRRLTSVTSSDGAAIALTYGANGKVATVTTNGRQWSYQYEQSADYGNKLAAVVLPDSSRWTFQYQDLYSILDYNKKVKWVDCEPGVAGTTIATLTIKHPAGATGAFSFRNMLHGVDRTPGVCYQPNPDKPLQVELSQQLMAYKVASLITKQISGPGAPTQTWSYQYQPSWSWNPNGYVDDCSNPSLCSATTTTDVTAPDGSVTHSVFGNDYYRNVGQLLSVDIVVGGSVVQHALHAYVPNTSTQPYALRAGRDFNVRNNPFETEQLHPVVQDQLTREGVTYTSAVASCASAGYCFDRFARPLSETLSNTLGFAKSVTTQYHDNTALWVLGQVASSSVNGMTAARTEFNAMAMPWKLFRFEKLQQTLTYSAAGTLATAADGAGNTTTLSNWKRGVPQSISYADGTSIAATVSDNGWITSASDETGSAMGYAYDAMGRLANVTYPGGDALADGANAYYNTWTEFRALTDADWKPSGVATGQWRKTEGTGNHITVTYYDAMWRPVLTNEYDQGNASSSLRAVRTEYDSMGHKRFESYPASITVPGSTGTRTFYDVFDRVTRIEQDSELGVLATTSEYLPGLRKRTTNPRGQQTTTAYMGWDKPNYDLPILIQQPEGKVVEIARHPQFGWPVSMTQRDSTNTLSQTRRYVYDGNGRLCKQIEPESGATVMGYDNADNLSWSAVGLDAVVYASTTDCQHSAAYASGRVSTRTYDLRNRLSVLNFPDGRGKQAWTYTPDGKPASLTAYNGNGDTLPVVTTYAYNHRGLLTGETLSQTGWYTWSGAYAYDAYGNLSQQTYPTGLTIDYAPNVFGQATKAGSYASGAQYYPNGALKQFTYGNGVVHTMLQNARQLPSQVTSSGVSNYSYNYDPDGNVTNVWDLARGDNYSRWLTYDNLDRLTAAGSASFGGDAWHRFTYDAVDNLTSWKLAGVKDYASYIYDAQNRLTHIRNTAGAAVVTLGYDAQGNASNKSGQAYDFDFGNRLRNVQGKESYRYDALGRRVQTTRTDGSKTTLWAYSQAGQMVFSSDWDGANYANHQTHQNIYLAGSVVAIVDRSWPSNAIIATRYQHTDALGSPVAVTNETGQVIERNDYEPYGAVIGKPAYSGIGYTGHVMDGGTSLTYMQQRYYDPTIGVFLSVDPLAANPDVGTGFNRYSYALDNPYRYRDPDGRANVYIGDQKVEDWKAYLSDKRIRQDATFHLPTILGKITLHGSSHPGDSNSLTKYDVTVDGPTNDSVQTFSLKINWTHGSGLLNGTSVIRFLSDKSKQSTSAAASDSAKGPAIHVPLLGAVSKKGAAALAEMKFTLETVEPAPKEPVIILPKPDYLKNEY